MAGTEGPRMHETKGRDPGLARDIGGGRDPVELTAGWSEWLHQESKPKAPPRIRSRSAGVPPPRYARRPLRSTRPACRSHKPSLLTNPSLRLAVAWLSAVV